MMLKQAAKAANLTRKAIEYYVELELVSPEIRENGYRDFRPGDVERLKEISFLRKLDLGVDEIRAVLLDPSGEALQKLCVQRELIRRGEERKLAILSQLRGGQRYDQFSAQLEAIGQNQTVAEKLLEAFPGYYGRLLCLHFARFLDHLAETPEQKEALWQILEFLDDAPTLSFPPDLQEHLNECTRHISTKDMLKMVEQAKNSIENPDRFLEDNRDMIAEYRAYKQSDEYKSTPTAKLEVLLKEFNQTSGYYDRFIPAMKRLSPTYAQYMRQMDIAQEKFLAQYPDAP